MRDRKPPSQNTEATDETTAEFWHRHSSSLIAPAHPIASGLLLRKGDGAVRADAEQAVHGAAGSHGEALPSALRARFESSLGADLGGVRVHTGPASAAAAAAVGARAYAVGNDVHFGANQYDPSSTDGQLLLAHEVAHTVQQGANPTRQHKLAIGGAQDHAEHEADRAAEAMVHGTRFAVTMGHGVQLARKPEDKPHQAIKDLVTKTNGDEAAAVNLLRAQAPMRRELIAEMREQFGDEKTDKILQQVRGDDGGEAAVEASCAKAKTTLLAKTAASAQAIRTAVQTGDAAGLKAASDAAVAAIDEAELVGVAGRDELEGADEEGQKKPTWVRADATCTDLDNTIAARASAVLMALLLPNEPVPAAAVAGGDSFATDIRARVEAMTRRVDGANNLAKASLDVTGQHGKPRLEAAQRVRDLLLTLDNVQRTYALSIIKQKAVGKDIVEFYEGNGTALRKEGGGLEVGAGGNSSAESGKQGAASVTPPLAGKPGEKGGVKAETSTGELGDVATKEFTSKDGRTKSVGTAGASVDVRGEDGSFRFEGAKFEAGFAMKGQPTVKVNGGYTQTTTPPTFDGLRWIVAWTVTASAGGGRSKDHAEAPNGAKLSGDFKASGSLVKGGSNVYPDDKAAKQAYEDGAFALMKLSTSLPDASQAAGMKEGETSTLGHSGDIAAGGSGSHVGVSVGAMASVGGGQDVKLTKGADGKLVVTFRDTSQKSASASIGTTGVSGSAGGGNAEAVSTTAEFDLATAEGKAAYEKWSATPSAAPVAGPGVRILSTGKGRFDSTNVGIGVGGPVVNGSASTTATTGAFTETTADGKHSQTTVVGSSTDAAKGFSPLAPDNKTRTDSIEITTTDGDTANSTYVVKSSIRGKQDASWANGELGKVMGEPSSAGQTLDGEKASGTTGKWTVEGSYTKAQMDDFMKKVAAGSIDLKRDPGAAELKKTLESAKTEQEKQAALAKWFSQRGADAAGDLRGAIGPPSMSVTLDGDKYLSGTTGAAAFEGRRVALEDRFLDPKLEGDKIRDLLHDVQTLYVEQLERRDHIANPKNYPELPITLRHQLVKQAAARYELVRQLRMRVVGRAKEAGLGDANGNTRLNQQMGEIASERRQASTLRSHAVDRRAKHNGALSAGHDSPRHELTRTMGVGTKKIGELYAKSDEAWKNGIDSMTGAEATERKVYLEDNLGDESRERAVKTAGAAADGYRAAQKFFAECASCLDVIYQQAMKYPTPETPNSMWNGYAGSSAKPGEPGKTMFYGTLD